MAKLTEKSLADMERRANVALGEKWPEDRECLGEEVVTLVAALRRARRELAKCKKAAATTPAVTGVPRTAFDGEAALGAFLLAAERLPETEARRLRRHGERDEGHGHHGRHETEGTAS